MIEFAAFVTTVGQLVLFHKNREITAWALCLVACALWGVVALASALWFLLAQQIVIAAIAGYALWRRVPWAL